MPLFFGFLDSFVKDSRLVRVHSGFFTAYTFAPLVIKGRGSVSEGSCLAPFLAFEGTGRKTVFATVDDGEGAPVLPHSFESLLAAV